MFQRIIIKPFLKRKNKIKKVKFNFSQKKIKKEKMK